MPENLFDEAFKSTELHDAVSEGDDERVRRLLEDGADVNARAWYEITPLMAGSGSPLPDLRRFIKSGRPPLCPSH